MNDRRLEGLRRRQANSLGFLLIRCGQLFNERGIAGVNAEAGRPVLREAHTKLLPHLQAPDGVRITELARVLGVTKQAVQPLVAELAEAGVVRVEADPADARARRVSLTAHGVDAMLHGTGVLERIERELQPRLKRGEVEKLKMMLRGLLGVLEAG
ncbi:MAG: MarR family transcriptional regulator [Myxococcaceae bacterium]|nr:MarR family transcriptional regulator [Myxococcaceae bacterium]